MRKLLILTLTGLGLTALTSPLNAQDIPIAVAGPMTGPVASIGLWKVFDQPVGRRCPPNL